LENLRSDILTPFFILFFLISSKAQKVSEMVINYHDLKSKNVRLEKQANPNFDEAKNIATSEWLKLLNLGYLNATIDSFQFEGNQHIAFLNEGYKFNINYTVEGKKSNNEFDLNQLDELQLADYPKKLTEIIDNFNNSGYPFAYIDISNADIDSNALKIKLKIDKGPIIKIDTLINPELSNKQYKLLKRLIDIETGSLFDYQKIKEIENKISKINYMNSLRPPAYEFVDGKAKIYTYVKIKSFNNANGIIGIQPDNDGQIQFTGNIMLNLNNNFNAGEKIEFKWRRMFNASQNLISSVNLPYLFGSPFEFNGSLNMIRKDSSFFNFDASVNLCYSKGPQSRIGIILSQNQSTNVQQSDYNFTSTKSFGFLFDQNQLNKSINPTNGWRIHSSILTGNKQTMLSTSEELVRTPNYKLKFNYQQHFRIHKKIIFKEQLKLNTSVNEQLFENELERIGGYNSIRGFDEESIWVSSYGISNTEIHFLLDNESSVFIFSDWAWTEAKLTEGYENNWLKSMGLGTTVGFNNGLLNLVYGLGSSVGEPIQLRTGKIHIGFTSFF
tara:strand:- start:1468 stop:3135 length:1668 start_codon:yes stop_codon:yes gene_type:complete